MGSSDNEMLSNLKKEYKAKPNIILRIQLVKSQFSFHGVDYTGDDYSKTPDLFEMNLHFQMGDLHIRMENYILKGISMSKKATNTPTIFIIN